MPGKTFALAALLAVAACNSSTSSRHPALSSRVARRHADLAFESFSAASQGARRLHAAIETLVATPTAATLDEARRAWRAARVPYTRTEAFRFYGGPIDEVEPLVNSWPVDESYIDYVAGAPGAGVINEAGAEAISAERIKAMNEREGEKNISAGFHPIEFLLWGQDLSADGPGARPLADFAAGTRAGARRGAYLQAAAAMLASELEAVVEAWRPDRAGNYRAAFLARPPEQAIALILKGLGNFCGPELMGERLTVAYETKDQENEHSCFSDNTRDDVVGDVEGVELVYRGGTDGPGLATLVAQTRPELAARMDVALAATRAAARAVPAPFDRAIMGRDGDPGRRAVKELIAALSAQTALLGEVAAALDVRVAAP